MVWRKLTTEMLDIILTQQKCLEIYVNLMIIAMCYGLANQAVSSKHGIAFLVDMYIISSLVGLSDKWTAKPLFLAGCTKNRVLLGRNLAPPGIYKTL